MAITNVQRRGKASLPVTSLSIAGADGWSTPTVGNLLVATANSDATVTMTTSGFTAGPSIVDGNGAYAWYKISAGTESTITVTPGVSAHTAMTVCEYAGVAASPFDASNSSTFAGSSSTSTGAAAVSTTASGDLIVAVALLHSSGSSTPTGASWTNSFVNQLSAASGGNTSADVTTFFGELIVGAAASYSTVCSWTNAASDRQHIIMAFREAAGAAAASPVFPRRPSRGLYMR